MSWGVGHGVFNGVGHGVCKVECVMESVTECVNAIKRMGGISLGSNIFDWRSMAVNPQPPVLAQNLDLS